MKISNGQLRRIIKEEIATVNDDAIKDVVMKVLSDEGGAAGEEPIEVELEDLEDEEISLPDEPIEDIIKSVPGVKRHADGDYIDTTQLESNLRMTIREALSTEVPDIRPHRKSSFQVHRERTMASSKAMIDSSLDQIAAELIKNPASVSKLLTTFQPAMDLDKHQQKFGGAGRIDAFLDKVEAGLQDRGVDRSTAIKFADSFFKFR